MRRKLLLVFAILSFVLGVVFGAIVPATMFAAAAGADNWLTYHNDRYGTTIDYPDQFKAAGSVQGRASARQQ